MTVVRKSCPLKNQRLNSEHTYAAEGKGKGKLLVFLSELERQARYGAIGLSCA